VKQIKEKTSLRTDKSFLVSILTQAGAEFKGLTCRCIFHDDQNASAGIYQKDGIWRFKCHTCEARGDCFDIKAILDKRPLSEILSEHSDNDGKMTAKAMKPPESKTKKIYYDLDKVAKGMGGVMEDRYEYVNPETGKVELVVLRIGLLDKEGNPDKTFRPLHINIIPSLTTLKQSERPLTS